jgi:transposase
LLGIRPGFAHDERDRRSFGMFTCQLIRQGARRQAYIVRSIGVPANSVKRSVKTFREEGIDAFYRARRARGPTVLKPDLARQAQERLYRGHSRRQVAQQVGIKPETLRKAINQGRLFEPGHGQPAEPHRDDPRQTPRCDRVATPRSESATPVTDKSHRTVRDAAAADELGMACTRVLDRAAASLGLLSGGAPTRFEPCHDVPFGGVMCALPGHALNGLFRHPDSCFASLGGYYTTLQVMTLLGYMALCRIPTVEQLQYQPPGELGKMPGLDRVPEVRCLRNKLASLAHGETTAAGDAFAPELGRVAARGQVRTPGTGPQTTPGYGQDDRLPSGDRDGRDGPRGVISTGRCAVAGAGLVSSGSGPLARPGFGGASRPGACVLESAIEPGDSALAGAPQRGRANVSGHHPKAHLLTHQYRPNSRTGATQSSQRSGGLTVKKNVPPRWNMRRYSGMAASSPVWVGTSSP